MGRSLDPLVQRFFRFFHAWRPKKSKKQPKNRVFGLVEPSRLDFEVGIRIFRPIFGVIFIFRAIARIFLLLFLCHRCRRYFTVIFQYFPDVERQGSVATHGCTVYLRSGEKPSHSDNLWVVDWNPLFDAFIFLFPGLRPRPPIWGLEGSRAPLA